MDPSEIAASAKMILITILIILFNYFVMPWIFPDTFHQAIYFSITTTASNIIAILLSWRYFAKTRCYEDELNIIATYSYKILGASATHLIFFIIRLAGNVLMVILLLTSPGWLAISFPALFNVKIFLLSYSIGNALYVYEAINNAIQVNSGVDFHCNERSMMCSIMNDPLFCDDL